MKYGILIDRHRLMFGSFAVCRGNAGSQMNFKVAPADPEALGFSIASRSGLAADAGSERAPARRVLGQPS